jgi:hypothetical protein
VPLVLHARRVGSFGVGRKERRHTAYMSLHPFPVWSGPQNLQPSDAPFIISSEYAVVPPAFGTASPSFDGGHSAAAWGCKSEEFAHPLLLEPFTGVHPQTLRPLLPPR